jgi:hypothetical protein
MCRSVRFSSLVFAVVLATMTLGVLPVRAGDESGAFGQGAVLVASGPAHVQPYFFPSWGGFGPYGFYGGGFYTPFINLPMLPPAYPYLPKYWWVEPYPSADPRQAGYNPNSGYPKEEVTTLLLTTYPLKTRVVLNGLFVGTSDSLGPMQLPLGVHVLRVESVGYEPSEIVLNVEQPTLQQLEVRLKRVARTAAAEPPK